MSVYFVLELIIFMIIGALMMFVIFTCYFVFEMFVMMRNTGDI